MKIAEIETLSLHDATLQSIDFAWKESQCRIILDLVTGKHVLFFSGVTSIEIHHDEPWGSSNSVNGIAYSLGTFEIEMQSGDKITIIAQELEFSSL